MEPSRREPPPGLTVPRWTLPVAVTGVLCLLAGVVVLFTGVGGDPAAPAAAPQAPRGPSAEYIPVVQPLVVVQTDRIRS